MFFNMLKGIHFNGAATPEAARALCPISAVVMTGRGPAIRSAPDLP